MTSVRNLFYEILDGASGDPRMKDYFLMGPATQLIILVVAYLYFVNKLGPNLMQNRKPYELKNVMILYNIFQIICNIIILFQVVSYMPNVNPICTNVNKSSTPAVLQNLRTHHNYLLLKVLDLLDTVFFVLRKKEKQISYLHVHHHIGMVVGVWISGKYFPGSHANWIALFNTFVHAVMYSYYLFTCITGTSPWWKKYVTLLQIVQHYLIFIFCFPVLLSSNCDYPKGLMGFFLCNVTLMIVLFTNFYRKTFSKKIKNT